MVGEIKEEKRGRKTGGEKIVVKVFKNPHYATNYINQGTCNCVHGCYRGITIECQFKSALSASTISSRPQLFL